MKLKRTTLANSPELFDKTIKLIESEFHYTKDNSFYKDFYPLMFQENHENCHLLVDEAKNVIAHIGLSKRKLAKKLISTNVYLIGGIAVDSAYQGQGIFKTFFKDIISEYEDRCSFFLLWSEKNILYSKHSFFEFGSVIETGQKEFNNDISNFQKVKFSSLTKLQLREVQALFERSNNYLHFSRTNRDWENITHIKDADFYVHTQDGQILNYFFVNKGADLKNIIHEVSFLNDEELINKFREYKLWLPEKHKQYIPFHKEMFVALIRVNPTKYAIKFLSALFNNELIINELTKDSINFTFNEKSYSTNIQEFIHLTLGPNCAQEFKKFSNYFYISGLDSV